jgi:hypothetical protein
MGMTVRDIGELSAAIAEIISEETEEVRRKTDNDY